MRRALFSACLLVLSVAALAQSELTGKDQFPQYRTLSGLVAGGYGLNMDGTPSFRGAMALSTPVGQSIGAGRFAFALANTSSTASPRFFDNGHEARSNGTLVGMMGVGSPIGNLTVGGMVLSSKGDNVLNLHFSPKLGTSQFAIGVGAQDVFSTGGSSGESIDNPQGGGLSRSLYVVGTAQFADTGYISAGIGTRRFHRPFGNVSYNVLSPVKAMVEYDSFNWNYGFGFDLGHFGIGSIGGDPDRKVNAQAYLGYVRGKYFTWVLSLSF